VTNFCRSGTHILMLVALVATIFLSAWVVYTPGLHGDFVFDDLANLPTLGTMGPVDNWPSFWRYITSGVADPIGRPIALLSFLADAHNWPADPYPFKRTNLWLHLLNAALLMLLLRNLGRHKSNWATHSQECPRLGERLDMAAVLGGAFWLLHPLLVSTTLYIVQREAMLPATFTLIGLILWLRGRRQIMSGQTLRGLCWIAVGLGACTVLALLSKANGILLPSLALVIELVWLRQRTVPSLSPGQQSGTLAPATSHLAPPIGESAIAPKLNSTYRWSMWLFAGVPTLAVVAFLLRMGWLGFVYGVSKLRPWTMGQRLLTEPRVLMDYFTLLWFPRPFTAGLFNDQIQASQSLWSPLTTLPSVLTVFGLVVGACMLRRTFPAITLAILFYFVGQSMESTTIPLELYFEHRNYLPATLLFWPLSLWLCGVRFSNGRLTLLNPPGRSQKDIRVFQALKFTLAAVLLMGLALMTHSLATLWGNNHDQALLWATLNPQSPRAQADAAQFEMSTNEPKQAVARLETALKKDPGQVQLAFNLIDARCLLDELNQDDLNRAKSAMATTRDPGTLLTQWFESNIELATNGRCQGLDLDTLDLLVDAGMSNENLTSVYGRYQDLLYLKGRIALARHDGHSALHYFNAALDQDIRPAAALKQAEILGSAGFPREGLSHLEHYQTRNKDQQAASFGMPRLHADVLRDQNYWANELAHLRNALELNINTEATQK